MDFQDRDNNPVAGRVTGAGDVISASTLLRWAAEGKIFEAGLGPEDTAIAMTASLADTTPSASLQAPSAATPLVIPIITRVSILNDGSALSRVFVAFTKPAGLCATALVLSSGAALTSKHSTYRSSPAQTAQQSTTLTAPTATALVAADYVTYDLRIAIDALLTTGLVALGEGPSNVHTYRWLEEGFPRILSNGAAQLVYVVNSTIDGTFFPYFQWAEVTKDDLY